MRSGFAALGGVLVLVLAGCSSPPSGHVSVAGRPQAITYAALGASETYGIGADDRYRQAWPQVFFNDALPATSTMYNLGIPGATTAQAITEELPAALAAHPGVVTVWLNVNDLVDGVSPAAYGPQLQQLVHALRQGGHSRVLVANLPDLRQLPAYRACLPGAPATGSSCLISPTLLPSAQQVGDVIAAYNATIAQVVRQEGATLVDLSASGALIAQHPDWISADGFHPNRLGYLAIARAFEAAYHKAG